MKNCLLACLLVLVLNQNIGTVKPDTHINMSYANCTAAACTSTAGSVTIAAEWRWLHYINNYDACFTGSWDHRYCPDATTCAKNCGYEGVSGPSEYTSTYGVLPVTNGVRLNYVTYNQNGQNVGSRLYFLESDTKYKMFKMLNREIAFDVDMSTLECGLNAAIYFVQMEQDGGTAKYPTNKAGAKYGTGYCDAQCAQVPFIAGQATSSTWGNVGACCAEFDLWEANKQAHIYTGHPCSKPGYYKCQGDTQCGFNGQRYNGVCDKDGCGLNPYRNGVKNFYGPGSTYSVDTTKPFTIVTQFVTTNGTDNGDLSEVRRFYVQNGKKIAFPKANISGMGAYNSINDTSCKAQQTKFGDSTKYNTVGGTKAMGQALKRGMVLVLSLWDDYATHMKWLDSVFPDGANPSTPGVTKGPCPTNSGDPNVLRYSNPNAYVTVTNLKVGNIGTTACRPTSTGKATC